MFEIAGMNQGALHFFSLLAKELSSAKR